VTEKAFENPKFVEDIVRDLAMGLEAEPLISWYSINSENFESIHSHNAYAQITRDKQMTSAIGAKPAVSSNGPAKKAR